MSGTVVATGTDVKFIGSMTPMTQTNWQNYFGMLHKTGIIDGLLLDASRNRLTDGSVIVNGLIAKIETDNGYTSITGPTSDEVDALFLVRVYLKQEKVELVRKTGIAAGASDQDCADVVISMIQDESSYCDRNDDYYEIALGYWSYHVEQYHAIDCRRFSVTPRNMSTQAEQISGNGIYCCSASADVMIKPFNPVDEAVIVDRVNFSGDVISFSKYFYLGYGKYNSDIAPLVYASLPISYDYRSSDFTVDGVKIKHTTTVGMTTFRVARVSSASIQHYIVTIHK